MNLTLIEKELLVKELKAAGLPEDQIKEDGFPNYTETNY